MQKLITSICLLLAFVCPLQAVPYFLVRTTEDSAEADGKGSFREAIAYANKNPGTVISFHLWDGTSPYFSFSSPLPPIIAKTIIDGGSVSTLTDTGATDSSGNIIYDETKIRPDPNEDVTARETSPVVTLDFSGQENGLVFSGTDGHSEVAGLILISSGGSGIRLESNYNWVHGCYIGTDGINNCGNTVAGITITGGFNCIGISTYSRLPALIQRNVIGCNPVDILISGPQASYNLIYGNFIGVATDGYSPLSSDISTGVLIDHATYNAVGVTYANVISGHAGSGVELTNKAMGNTVGGNLIGTGADPTLITTTDMATTGVPNQDGIRLTDGATGNMIGGVYGNVICGNNGNGVYLLDSGTANTISKNSIGVTRSDGDGNFTVISNLGNGIDIHNTIATTITNNTVSGNMVGIAIADGSYQTIVKGNKIGTDSLGLQGAGNQGPGILITSGSGNTIGYPKNTPSSYLPFATTLVSNLISGNATGIFIDDSSDDSIVGNAIGTDAPGVNSIPNSGTDEGTGSGLFTTGSNQTIYGNLISGNAQDGIWLSDASKDTLTNNTIGLDLSGSNALGNGRSGIYISGGGSHVIGGATATTRNFISGNQGSGIELSSSGNQINSNYIGTSKSGAFVIGNGGLNVTYYGLSMDAGILVKSGTYDATTNTIGSSVAGSGNLISGNDGDGVRLDGDGVSDNTVVGNTIGFAANLSPFPNSGNGVGIYDGANSNHIGLGATGANQIATDLDGIAISGTDSISNAIRGNSVLLTPSSIGIPINFIRDINDPDPPTPAPVLVSVNNLNNLAVATGSFNGAPLQSFTIDFYKAPPEKAASFLSLSSLVITTDAAGKASFSKQIGAFFGGQMLYATAMDSANTSSEFSNGSQIPMLCQFAVLTATVSESATSGRLAVVVNRTGDLSNSGTLTLITQNGTAKAGIDFGTLDNLQPVSVPVVFAANSTTGTANIPIINNSNLDTVRSFGVAMVASPQWVSNSGPMTVTITDDEQLPAPMLLTINNLTNQALVTGTYHGPANQSLTLYFSRSLSGETPVNIKTLTLTTDSAGNAPISTPLGLSLGGYTIYSSVTTASGATSPLSNGLLVPMLCQFAASTATISESASSGRLAVVVNRTGNTTKSGTLALATQNGTAKAGVDFGTLNNLQPLAIPMVFAAGSTTGTANVPIINNSILDTVRSFGVAMVASATCVFNPVPMTVTITDDERLPAPVLQAVNNLTNQALITGTYHGPANQSLTLYFSRSLSGETPVNFKTLTLTTDTAGNAPISTSLGLSLGGYTIYSSVLGASGAISPLSNGLLVPMLCQFAATTATISESASSGRLAVVVNRTGNTTKSDTLILATQNGTAKSGIDFGTLNSLQPLAMPVIFAAGSTTGTANIPILNNSILNTVRSFGVAMVASATCVFNPSPMAVTITDDEKIPAPVLLTVDNLVNQALVTGTYHGPANQALTIDFSRTLPGGAASYFKSVTINTDSAGNALFSAPLGANLGGYTIYCSAEAASGASSQLSTGLVIPMLYRLPSTPATISESATSGKLAIIVSRFGDVSKSGTITVSAQNGTAKAGVDFGILNNLQPLLIPTVFAPGATTGTANIPIINNTKANGERSLIVSLVRQANSVMNPQSMVANITDDEIPNGLIGFTSASFRGNESTKGVAFVLQRSGGLGKIASVTYSLTNGSATAPADYTVPAIRTVPFGVSSTTATVVIPTIPHLTLDQPKTFTMTLLTSSSESALASGTTNPTSATLPIKATGTICDDSNPAGALQFTAANLSVQENVGSAKLTVTRLSGTSGTVTVRYATSNITAIAGSDYTAPTSGTGTITFAPNQQTATITIPITSDLLIEPTESFRVTLSAPTGGATLAAQNTMDVTIQDDDSLDGVLQFSTPPVTTSEKTGPANIVVTRLGGISSVVSVQYTTAPGAARSGYDYTTTYGSLTFYAGQRTAIITVPIVKDTVAEPAESFTVTLSNPTNGAVLGVQNTSTVTISAD